MRRTVNVLFVVFCGVVGAWAGYWIGYLAGWSEGADWPATVGGGTGAVLLSIGMSVLFVLASASALFLVPEWWARRALAGGMPAEATVVSMEETGAQSRVFGAVRHQVACELEVCGEGGTPYRARTTQFVTDAESAALRPGARVKVRIDPRRPSHVAIEGPRLPVAG